MRFPSSLQSRIETLFESSVTAVSSCSGGCINHAAIVTLESGDKCFVKWNDSPPAGLFEAEAHGLEQLARAEAIKVPEVLAVGSDESDCPDHLVLEALEPGGSGLIDHEKFGRRLAALHSFSEDTYGLDRDNFIGSLEQINTPAVSASRVSWGEFFIEKRLKYQAGLGEQNSWFGRELAKLFLDKEDRMQELLDEEPEEPALLHGDLWSGNVFWSSDGPALIDPAVYYGNREADIAFLELFGSPGERVVGAYNEVKPLKEGYGKRKDVHNLYHLMNHANLFGRSYITSVRDILRVI